MTPEKIGPYRIQEVALEDELTVTYRATDPALGRTLLLKTARTANVEATVGERLAKEARLCAKLSSAGILVLHGLVRRDSSTTLLFEDAPGPRLSELLEKTSALSVARAVAITLQVAKALAHIHSRGLVHAGIRPERIFIGLDGTVRIADFSTMHLAGEADDSDAPRPPEYMAPEQILSEGTGPRADVFSLGAVMFLMLSGERPWTEPPPPEKSPDVLAPAPPPEPHHLLAQRIRSAAPPPLKTVEGSPPSLLARIVSRCLAKDPADRYADGQAVVEDLEDALLEASTESAATLTIRALAQAGYVPDLPPKPARMPLDIFRERDHLRKLVSQLAMVFGLIVLGALVTEVSRAGSRPAPPPSETPPGARGYVRVLVLPWADVIVDGEPIDTTPMAQAIEVAPGRHFVTFVHPNAPEEKRTIDVAAGQTVLLDVEMQIVRPIRDAGSKSAPVDDSP